MWVSYSFKAQHELFELDEVLECEQYFEDLAVQLVFSISAFSFTLIQIPVQVSVMLTIYSYIINSTYNK